MTISSENVFDKIRNEYYDLTAAEKKTADFILENRGAVGQWSLLLFQILVRSLKVIFHELECNFFSDFRTILAFNE